MPGTFNIDHTDMHAGIYVPGKDIIGDREIITLDVRVTSPYNESALLDKEIHTTEHILAVAIEEACKGTGINKIYWGPMGCRTGFYLLLDTPKDSSVSDIINILIKACENAPEDTPAFDIKRCGNAHTLYPTSMYVMWIISKILKMSKRVLDNNSFDEYNYLD